MLFNSFEFPLFLIVVFVLYWFVFQPKVRLQNAFIVSFSYFFYGWWDWRFLSLIILSTIVDYFIAIKIHQSNDQKKRRLLLGISLFTNLGILGIFKYWNFFIESWIDLFSLADVDMNFSTLEVVLPVGISFYTFQTLSYTIDVFRKKLDPTKDFVDFAAFVSFFPQLVAGPIERATNLLPQIKNKRLFSYDLASDGMRQILWGFFKKLVIADNCAVIVNEVFADYASASSSELVLGAIFFAFQIYGDFSGYSDIAIGIAKLFGFKLMTNFRTPYFSRDIAEFWRRWHISLSTWFRDYLYIPLGGSRGSQFKIIRNVFIIFIVSGLWHGANWTFVAWGFLNALFFIPLLLFKRNRKNLDVVAEGKLVPSLKEFFQMSVTFFITTCAWVFFRSPSIGDAISYISGVFNKSLLSIPNPKYFIVIPPICFLVLIEWILRKNDHTLQNLKCNKIFRMGLYSVICLCILLYMPDVKTDFIYFQF